MTMHPHHLHIETPLIESVPLSRKVNGTVWLKMDALQPSGSFKLRGIGAACRKYIADGARQFVCSSGGNAGIAVAYSGRKLGIPVIVVVPETAPNRVVEIMQAEGARVVVHGRTWGEAHRHSQTLMDDSSAYIHPFDDPLVWSGHATIIDEVAKSNLVPDVVVLSVGGGGLMCGVIDGLYRHGMVNVPILAVETEGAASLSASVKSGQHVEIIDFKSIATSLGPKKVAKAAYDWYNWHEVVSHVVSDKAALEACVHFSTDHRLLVEPACGACLAPVYDPVDFLMDKQNILVIVCGGAGVTVSQFDTWKNKIDKAAISADMRVVYPVSLNPTGPGSPSL